jgi:hypothetical protein
MQSWVSISIQKVLKLNNKYIQVIDIYIHFLMQMRAEEVVYIKIIDLQKQFLFKIM